ncbi:MAG: tyrosine-type recombinase/integrase, partial [Thermoproteales archaeon]|nr:tyrosine-type recombinase/integrase [Thermoproteales archaeon]
MGEILSLRVRDVSFDELGARIRIWRSKSESRVVRVVLYASDLARLVEGRDPEEYVFTRNYNTYLRWLTRAWAKAELPRVRRKFHILRHTRATEVYGRMSEKAMMIWFGWKTREMIDVYARVKPEQAEEEYLAALGVAEKRSGETVARCPRCGAPNPPTAKYCQRCAMPLSREEQLEMAKAETLMAEILD